MRPLIAVLCGLNDADGGSPRDSVPHAYGEAVRRAGGVPVLVPCGGEAEDVVRVLDTASGLIITGGVDVDPTLYGQQPRRELGALCPARDALDRVAVQYALERRELPVLGICRGIQALNVFAGGTLIQDIPTQVPGALKHSQQAPGWYGTHVIEIAARSVLAATLETEGCAVNSYHHQAVENLAPGFRVVARTADAVVEAIEREGARYCVGVQFHPELMAGRDERIARLFARLVEEA